MDTKQIQEQLQSKRTRSIVKTIGIAAITLLVFSAGMEVGFMKASFNYHFGESYYRSFGPENSAHDVGLIPNDIGDAHGAAGKIVSINLPTLVMTTADNTEKIIRLDDDTVIREMRDTIPASNLKTSDFIVVIGSPNAGAEVEAKFIRVMPLPPQRVQIPVKQ